MLTTPFDTLKFALHRWLHDYHHRAQIREKQIKRWRKMKARLAEELAKEDIYELRGWYRKVWKSPVPDSPAARILRKTHEAMMREGIDVRCYLVRALFSHAIDVRVSGPGGRVVFGRKTDWGKVRK